MYLACKKIAVKEKAVYCGLLLIFCELFHQCAEFYLAWLPLSEQPSMQTVLHLHLPDAVYLLPGVYVSG